MQEEFINSCYRSLGYQHISATYFIGFFGPFAVMARMPLQIIQFM